MPKLSAREIQQIKAMSMLGADRCYIARMVRCSVCIVDFYLAMNDKQ